MIKREAIFRIYREVLKKEPREIDIERFLCGYNWNEVSIREQLENDTSRYAKLRVYDNFDYEKYDHLFFLHSTGIGGAEKVISLLLECLSLDVRRRCAVITTTNVRGLSFPNGVKIVTQRCNQWNNIFARRYKSIWVQPFIGFNDSFVSFAIEHGSKVMWLVVSQYSLLIEHAKSVKPSYYISTTEQLDQLCIDNGLVPFVSLPHFVLDSKFIKHSTSYRLGYVGRNSEEKNSANLPFVLQLLPSNYTLHYFVPKVHAPYYDLSNRYLRMVDDNVKSSSCSKRIFFTFDETDTDKIFSQIDVLLLPSKYEGYSLVAHEALVRGIPVVIPEHLMLGNDVNPGLVKFKLHEDFTLSGDSLISMADAIRNSSFIDKYSIYDSSRTYTKEYFITNHLSKFLDLLGEV